LLLVLTADDEEPVVMPEIGSSLTNITWNDDHNNDDDIAHDDWLDSGTLTDDISLTQPLAEVNIFKLLFTL